VNQSSPHEIGRFRKIGELIPMAIEKQIHYIYQDHVEDVHEKLNTKKIGAKPRIG
jgi:hypothetical protein